MMLDYLIHNFQVPELAPHMEELKRTQHTYAQALEKIYTVYYERKYVSSPPRLFRLFTPYTLSLMVQTLKR
jgi:hypothetical protein